jgi:tRNA pseudouridine38-40 synthase
VFRYFIRLSYNGTAFCGWQFQPGVPTVQESLNEKMSLLLRERIDCIGCGRTDSGVHARKFFAHFDSTHAELENDEKTVFRLNKMLPPGIAIQYIRKMVYNAHARFAATSRSYEYHISRVKDPFGSDLSWELHEKLDVEAMDRAAKILLEYQDFAAFCKAGGSNKTTLCTITSVGCVDTGNGMVFSITANRFLRNMVRAIVGTLVDIGRGKMPVEDMHRVIQSGKRAQAGNSVPAEGLYLVDVVYPPEYGLN